MGRSNYALVNPLITGSMNTIFKASDPKSGAKKAYDTLSSFFSNSVPNFMFTLKNDDTLYHFKVKEKVKDGKVYSNIVPLKVEGSTKEEKVYIRQNLEAFHRAIEDHSKKMGGKHHDSSSSSSDSSSSDSSSSDIYTDALNKAVPYISNMWYTPVLYYSTEPDYIYIPSLIPLSTLNPPVIKYYLNLKEYFEVKFN